MKVRYARPKQPRSVSHLSASATATVERDAAQVLLVDSVDGGSDDAEALRRALERGEFLLHYQPQSRICRRVGPVARGDHDVLASGVLRP